MKNIYVIITHTGTILSKIVRKATGNKYNHVSIALEKDLKDMYSFGRRNPYICFYGGFVIEHITSGTFYRFKNTICKVLEISVDDESYKIVSSIIEFFKKERKSFKFNIRGMLKARKNINFQKSYRKFYCSQFIKYVLTCAHVTDVNFFGNIATPQSFEKIPQAAAIYEGLLRDYPTYNMQINTVDLIIPKHLNISK